jgi:hypothetical protein
MQALTFWYLTHVFKIQITAEIALKIVQLVDERVDLQIVGVIFNPQCH